MSHTIHPYPIARRVGARAILIAIAFLALALTAGTAAGDTVIADATPPPAWQEPFLLHNSSSVEGGGTGNSFHWDNADLGDELLFLHSGPITSMGKDSFELWRTDGSTTGTRRLARHIEWNPGELTALGGSALFVADDAAHGRELWISGGSDGPTQLLRDIRPGAPSSNPALLTRVGDSVYFRADGVQPGGALWRSDGTAAGTIKVKDFPQSFIWDGQLIQEMVATNTFLYLWVKGPQGDQLWRSDGTAGGTLWMHEFPPTSGFLYPPRLSVVGDIAYIHDNVDLWRSDGTVAGTYRLPGPAAIGHDAKLIPGNSLLYIFHRVEWNTWDLWQANGSAVTKVKDIGLLQVEAIPATIGNTVFFVTVLAEYGDPYGQELWASDGSAAGTRLVKEVSPGPEGSGIFDLVPVGNILYYSATQLNASDPPMYVPRLWRSNGTAAGTYAVPLNTGDPIRPDVRPTAAFNNKLFLYVTDPVHGHEPWISDGTTVGSFMLADATITDAWPSNPTNLTFYRDRLYFWTPDGLYISDGAELSASILAAHSAERAFDPFEPGFVGSNGFLFFAAQDTVRHLDRLWRTDGSQAGTVPVADVGPTSDPYNITQLTDADGLLYFVSTGRQDRSELWRSDGQPAGTYLIHDIGPLAHNIANLTALGRRVLFTAHNATGNELWVSYGSDQATGQIADINPGSADSNPSGLIAYRNTIYFAADDGQHGVELWRSDGTVAGTALLKDINPLPGQSSAPGDFVVMGNVLYFIADDGVHGRELWRSDGTANSTYLVRDSVAGGGHPPALELVAGLDSLYFTAADANNYQIWRSDGTAAGTTRVTALAYSHEYRPKQLTTVGNELFFVLNDGNEHLYQSDGTAEGTFALHLAFPFFDVREPTWLTSSPGRLFFSGDSNAFGREPYVALTTLLELSTPRLDLAEDSAAQSLKVVLNRQPSSSVQIAIASSESLTLLPASLTLTSTNWRTPQTVMVGAPADEGQETRLAELRFSLSSADARFDGQVVTLPVLIQRWHNVLIPAIAR